MQQDTSDHKVKLGGKKTSLACSGLYFRYSKMRYIKFYPSYNRFNMKCFFHEALTHMKYSAENCIIDNTHLAVLHGTGSSAVFAPEMLAFARNFGFKWVAHEKNHPNQEWGCFLKNQHLTAALLDRITENCTVFNMKNCISIRPKKIVYATQKSPSEEKI